MNCFFRPFPGALFRFPHRFFPSLLFLFAGTAVFAGSAPRRVLAQDASAQTAPASGSAIALIINGRAVQNDPPPVLSRGSTLVPLRGVLENLGATVTYLAAEKRIRIQQGARQVELTVDSDVAMVDGRSTPLPAAPRVMEGRTFVPLRFLAELFGYTVNWFPATRTVTISGGIPAFSPEAARRHQTALQAASAVGVTINFHDSPPADIEPLLDAAQRAGVTLIRTRFDWNALEPTRGAEFNWALYDRIVRAARERGLTVVGILGNSAHWASQFSTLPDRSAWRNAPPRDDALEEWQNYVRRVVGRYANDVHAWQIWESPSSSWFRGGAIKFRTVARLAAEATRASDPGALIFLGEPGGVNLNFINDLNRNGVTPGINGLTLYPTSQWQPGALSTPESYLRPLAALRRELLPSTSGVRHLWIAGLSFPDLNAPPPVPAPTAEASEAEASEAESSETKTPAAQVQPAAQTDAAAPRLQPVAASEAVVIEVADEGTVVRNTALDERIFNTEDKEMRQALKERFTAMAQADYLMQSLVLARAAGVEKTFWGNLRDSEAYDSVDPFDPVYGSGLLRLDNTPRPSYKALQNVISLLQDKPYVGRLAFGPDIAALIFDNGKEGVAAVWAIQGEPRLIFNTTGIDPHAPDAVYLRTTVESQLLDSTGRPLTEKGTEGILKLSSRPVWITKTDVDVARAAKNHPAGEPLVVSDEKHQYPAGGVRAVFDETTPEEGLYWRKYADFRGEAQQLTDVNGGTGLRTEISRDIFNPASGKPSIFLDVADDYLFYAGEGRGEPVQVTVTVARPAPSQSQVVTTTAGFNLRYDAPSGQRFTRWQTVDEGEGWATYTFELPDASFGNVDGYDLAINTFGSKRDLVFGSVTVKRLIEPAPTPTSTPTATPTAMPATTPAPASTPAAVSTPEPPTAPTPSAPTPAAPTSTAPTPTHVPPILNSPIPDLPAPPNANG